MQVKEAEFVKSSAEVNECPAATFPEHAFIGRSNVGKSSLINAISNRKKLAKISSTPGKTKLINHFKINNTWYLVDLPGYGWAKVSKTEKATFNKMIRDYISQRKNLLCVFVLVDIRHKPQQIDMDFMRWLGENELPFSIVFTKADKLKRKGELEKSLEIYKEGFLKEWEALPDYFISSSVTKIGIESLLDYIDGINQLYNKNRSK